MVDGDLYGMQTFDQSLVQPLPRRAGRRAPTCSRTRASRARCASRSIAPTSSAVARRRTRSPEPSGASARRRRSAARPGGPLPHRVHASTRTRRGGLLLARVRLRARARGGERARQQRSCARRAARRGSTGRRSRRGAARPARRCAATSVGNGSGSVCGARTRAGATSGSGSAPVPRRVRREWPGAGVGDGRPVDPEARGSGARRSWRCQPLGGVSVSACGRRAPRRPRPRSGRAGRATRARRGRRSRRTATAGRRTRHASTASAIAATVAERSLRVVDTADARANWITSGARHPGARMATDDHRSRRVCAAARPGVAGAAARAPARRRRATSATSSAAAVRDAFLDRTRARRASTSTSRPTPGPTSSSARARRGPTTCGSRASASAPSAARKDGVPIEITTFRADVYRPESRKPEVAFSDDIETDLSRRDFTVNAMALRLPEPELVDPFGGAVDLAARPAAHAARAGGLVPRRPAAHAARGAVRRRLRPRARPRARRTPSSELRHRLEIVERGAHPRRALEAPASSTTRARGCGSSRETRLSDEFLPELNAMRLEQDPIHTHKDVLAHTIAVVRNTRARAASCASPRCSTTSASRRPGRSRPAAVSFHHHEVVGARMTEERLRALQYPNDVVEDVTQARVPAPAHPHVRDGLDRQGGAPLRARRRDRCSTTSTTCSAATAPRATRTGRARWRGGWTSSRRASPSCASRRSSTPSARRSTAGR